MPPLACLPPQRRPASGNGPMIVDCHAHVIQNWIGACGHPTRDLHMKYLQRVIAGTVARTYRARDGAPADTKALIRADEAGWSGLKDVDFRVGNYGRLDFTIDGEDYYSQYMPIGMQQIVAPPELMLTQMVNAGVDHTVLQTGWGYGAMNDYNAFAQNQYPDKFTAMLTSMRQAYTTRTCASSIAPPAGPAGRLFRARCFRALRLRHRVRRSPNSMHSGPIAERQGCRCSSSRRPGLHGGELCALHAEIHGADEAFPTISLRAGDGAPGRLLRQERTLGVPRTRAGSLPPRQF